MRVCPTMTEDPITEIRHTTSSGDCDGLNRPDGHRCGAPARYLVVQGLLTRRLCEVCVNTLEARIGHE